MVISFPVTAAVFVVVGNWARLKTWSLSTRYGVPSEPNARSPLPPFAVKVPTSPIAVFVVVLKP